MTLPLQPAILRMPRLLLVVLAVLLIVPQAAADAPPDLGDDDPLARIQAFVDAQPVPVTAHDIAGQFAFLADDPAYGTAASFTSSSGPVSVAALSATQFVVAYEDFTNSSHGTARVGSVSGTTITYSDASVFNAKRTNRFSVVALSSTQFVVAYVEPSSAQNLGKAIVGSVSGGAITFGTVSTFNNDRTSGTPQTAALSSTQFVVAYLDFNNSTVEMIVGGVSGGTITFGTASNTNIGSTGLYALAALSSTDFVLAYRDPGNSDRGTALVGSVSGTMISYGSGSDFGVRIVSALDVAALSSTHFVAVYDDADNNGHGTAIVGSVSGGVITYGSASVFNAEKIGNSSVAALDAATFVVAYYDGVDFGVGCESGPCAFNSIVGDVSGTGITGYSNEVNVDDSSGSSRAIDVVNIGSFVVAYQDMGDFNGKAVVSSTGGALPVELTDFTATTDARDVLLRWNTASETNNAGFQVQYQAVGPDDQAPDQQLSHWEVDGFVEGQGTTLQAQRYTYRLADLEPGRYRLRLKQVDYDGTFEYSPVTETTIELAEQFSLTPAYPNPFNPEAQFTLSVQRRQQVSVRVYNVLGRVVATLHEGEMAANQAQRFRFDASALPSGAYQIQVVGETFQASERVVLMK